MLPLIAKYKETEIKFNLPQSWEDITLYQYIELSKWDRKDLIQLFAVITGIDYDVFFNCESEGINDLLLTNLEFLKEPLDLEALPLPKEIEIDGKKLEVPQDITQKTFGQKISLQLYLAEAVKNEKSKIDCLAFAIALYFFPEIAQDKYNEDEAKKIIPLIEKCKLVEAYPIGSFFLNKFLE